MYAIVMVQMNSINGYRDLVLFSSNAKKLKTGDLLKNVTSDQIIMKDKSAADTDKSFNA